MREWFTATSKMFPDKGPFLHAEWSEEGVRVRLFRESRPLFDLAHGLFSNDWFESVPGWNPYDCPLPTWRPPEVQRRGSIGWFRCLAMDLMNWCNVEYGYEDDPAPHSVGGDPEGVQLAPGVVLLPPVRGDGGEPLRGPGGEDHRRPLAAGPGDQALPAGGAGRTTRVRGQEGCDCGHVPARRGWFRRVRVWPIVSMIMVVNVIIDIVQRRVVVGILDCVALAIAIILSIRGDE